MDHLLVYGIDTVAGANIAATLADRYQITGISRTVPVSIEGCTCILHQDNTSQAADDLIEAHSPDWIIHCGEASKSTWFESEHSINQSIVDETKHWAKATSNHEIAFTIISSDAVYTGPWMFHEEEGESFCDSSSATAIREMETEVAKANPEALIVRTNVFGWTPGDLGEGWIEQLLDCMEEKRIEEIDGHCYATPILASDLANILHRAFDEELTGLFHIAAAERVTPLQFVRKLADQFNSAWLSEMTCQRTCSPVESRPNGFGQGESSLQTKKIRKALCVAMPTLSEGLERLHEQSFNGYCDAMSASDVSELQSRAA